MMNDRKMVKSDYFIFGDLAAIISHGNAPSQTRNQHLINSLLREMAADGDSDTAVIVSPAR